MNKQLMSIYTGEKENDDNYYGREEEGDDLGDDGGLVISGDRAGGEVSDGLATGDGPGDAVVSPRETAVGPLGEGARGVAEGTGEIARDGEVSDDASGEMKGPFLRWKKNPFLAAMCTFSTLAIVFPISSFLHMETFVFKRSLAFPKSLISAVIFMSLYSIGVAFCKDVPDVEGDQDYGVYTSAVLFGRKRMFQICVFLFEMAYGVALFAGVTSPFLWIKIVTTIFLDSEGQPTYKDFPTSARATYGLEYYVSPSAPTMPIPGQKGYVPPTGTQSPFLYTSLELSIKPRPTVPYTNEWRLKSITNTKSVDYTVEELEEQFKQLMTEAELTIKFPLLLESESEVAASEVAASVSEFFAYEDTPSDEVPTSVVPSYSHIKVVPYLCRPYIPHLPHVASDAYRALPPNAIINDPLPIIQRPIYSTEVIKFARPWRPPPGTPHIEMPLHEVEDLSQVDPYSTPLKDDVSQITLRLPSLRLSPVPLNHSTLPYLTAKEHQLINHLQLCPSMPHQHTIHPSLWLRSDASIRISLDRVCPRLPPANNNKLKGKKIYRGPMPAPSKMCIKSFPDMTHSRV
ncbi:hypothetical protein Fmac_011510 [Flemingia macrophylla]|uniref:Uncharacterized protein n=1 Tax=Flemingia macrophylla TaxID=520843 RepID=A0ABD1MMN8_9FABA